MEFVYELARQQTHCCCLYLLEENGFTWQQIRRKIKPTFVCCLLSNWQFKYYPNITPNKQVVEQMTKNERLNLHQSMKSEGRLFLLQSASPNKTDIRTIKQTQLFPPSSAFRGALPNLEGNTDSPVKLEKWWRCHGRHPTLHSLWFRRLLTATFNLVRECLLHQCKLMQ